MNYNYEDYLNFEDYTHFIAEVKTEFDGKKSGRTMDYGVTYYYKEKELKHMLYIEGDGGSYDIIDIGDYDIVLAATIERPINSQIERVFADWWVEKEMQNDEYIITLDFDVAKDQRLSQEKYKKLFGYLKDELKQEQDYGPVL